MYYFLQLDVKSWVDLDPLEMIGTPIIGRTTQYKTGWVRASKITTRLRKTTCHGSNTSNILPDETVALYYTVEPTGLTSILLTAPPKNVVPKI